MFAPACQSDGSIALLLVSGWFTPKLCVILGIVLSLPICLFVNASFGVRYSIESVCCVCGGGAPFGSMDVIVVEKFDL